MIQKLKPMNLSVGTAFSRWSFDFDCMLCNDSRQKLSGFIVSHEPHRSRRCWPLVGSRLLVKRGKFPNLLGCQFSIHRSLRLPIHLLLPRTVRSLLWPGCLPNVR